MKLSQLKEAQYEGPHYEFDDVMRPVIQWARQRIREEDSDTSDGDLVGEIIDEVGRYIWENID